MALIIDYSCLPPKNTNFIPKKTSKKSSYIMNPDEQFWDYVDEEGKQCWIKYKDYLKYIIPDFKLVFGDLVTAVIKEEHDKSFQFKIPFHLDGNTTYLHFRPGWVDFTDERRLTCLGEIRTIKFLRRYLRYLTCNEVEFSIKLHYKSTHSKNLDTGCDIGFHIYEIKLN